MNKKGYMKVIVEIVLAIVFLLLITVGILRASNNEKQAKTCSEDNCQYSKTEGCPSNEYNNPVFKCEDEEKMCCLEVGEQPNSKSGSGNGTVPTNNTQVIKPATGNIYIKLGEAQTNLDNTAKTLKAGVTYSFKVTIDGALETCTIKVLNKDTMAEVTDSWIQGTLGTASSACKTGATVTITPTIIQIGEGYIIQIEAQNTTSKLTKTAAVNLNIIQS